MCGHCESSSRDPLTIQQHSFYDGRQMIDWTDYDRFDWNGSRQEPMSQVERNTVEELAARILQLSEAHRQSMWGRCSPPGRFAATVVKVSSHFAHRYSKSITRSALPSLGIKLLKSSNDARREATKIVPFHRDQLDRLPGIPNDHIQRSVDADMIGAGSSRRGYVVQEWIEGESLETLVRRKSLVQPIDPTAAHALIEQLYARIVIPLWSVGTIWWDIRDANFVWNEKTGRLTMIDVDSLAAYADEILNEPDSWTRRDKGRETALARLRQLTLRILLAQGLTGKSKVERTLKEIWTAELEPVLERLGRGSCVHPDAALHGFLTCLNRAPELQPSNAKSRR